MAVNSYLGEETQTNALIICTNTINQSLMTSCCLSLSIYITRQERLLPTVKLSGQKNKFHKGTKRKKLPITDVRSAPCIFECSVIE